MCVLNSFLQLICQSLLPHLLCWIVKLWVSSSMRGVRIRAGSRMAAWLMWCQTGNKYGSSWEWDLHTCAQSASCSGCFLFAVLLIVCVAHILTVSLYGSCHKHHALHFYVIYLFLYFGWRWVPEGGICFFFTLAGFGKGSSWLTLVQSPVSHHHHHHHRCTTVTWNHHSRHTRH